MASDRAASGSIIGDPTLRQAALVTIAGYALTFGTPFASFHALPKLYVEGSAAQTSQNILANHGLFVAAIFAMLANFVGDVLAAWGLYALLRPVNASWSMLVSVILPGSTTPPPRSGAVLCQRTSGYDPCARGQA